MSGLNYGKTYLLCNSKRPLKPSGNKNRPIYVFDENENQIAKYETMHECSKNEKQNRSTIRTHIKNTKKLNNKYYSFNEYININTNIF